MPIESLLNMTIFTAARKKKNTENNIADNNSSQQSETRLSQVDPLVKCYVGISSGQPNRPYEINDLFNGKLDAIFKSRKEGENKPSFRFTSQYIIFSSINEDAKISAAKLTALRGHGDKTAYLLEMGYSKKEVKLLAAQGQFSKAILGAFDAKELCSELIFHTKTNTQYCTNPNFDPSLLEKSPCGDYAKAASL